MPSNGITAKEVKLKRELGLFELMMYGVGIILGAGIYALIGKAAGVAGNALWMAFGIGALIATFTGLSYAELGSMFPKEAAEYIYSKRAFRSHLLSFLIGWLIIFIGCVAAATVALGFGGYFYSLTGVSSILSAIVLIAVLSALNFWGIKESAKANILFTLIELSGLLLIIFLAANYFGSVNYFEAPAGISGVFAAAILIFFAYLGFEDIVNMAEETKNPKKVVPKALILSILISTVLYILVSLSAVSIMPWQKLGASAAPLADVANVALPGSAVILSLIALFATSNTVLILLIVESRMAWGMAHEGSLPRILSKIHHIRRTPWIAIIGVMALAGAFTLIGNIKTVAEITDWGAFLIFMSVNASLIWLRFKEPKLKRPFKVPLNIGRFPVLPALGIAFCLFMLTHFDLLVTSFGIFILVLGIILYYSIGWLRKL